MISQIHQPVLALGAAGNADAVPVRPAGRRRQNGVAGARHVQHLVRAEGSVKIPGGAVEDALIDFQWHLCLPGDPVEDTKALGQYFRPMPSPPSANIFAMGTIWFGRVDDDHLTHWSNISQKTIAKFTSSETWAATLSQIGCRQHRKARETETAFGFSLCELRPPSIHLGLGTPLLDGKTRHHLFGVAGR